jgi:sn-glycerol 3-phosphate transport system permease protein
VEEASAMTTQVTRGTPRREHDRAVPTRRRPGGRRGLRDAGPAYLFLLPSLLVFAAFVFYPLVRTAELSFQANDIFGAPGRFVGGSNYARLFTDPAFRHVLVTTALFTLYTVVPGIVIALALALLLQGRIRGVRFFRTAFALPFAFSVATASVIFTVLYDPAAGVLNGLLGHVGAGPVKWLTDPKWALLSISAATVWLQLGYNLLVIAAGLGAIPDEVVEAARLDGARNWSMVRRVTLPLITPQLFFLVVVGTIQSLQSFGQIHILTKGGPAGATTTLVYSIYKTAFAFNASDYGYASAQAIVLLAVVLVVTAVQFGVLERKVFYS